MFGLRAIWNPMLASWRLLALLAIALSTLIAAPRALAQQDLDDAARGIEIDEHLGRQLPLDLDFTTSDAKKVQVKDYFTNTNKPAIVAMVYYRCPLACQIVMEKLTQCLNDLDMDVGKDFRVLFFSIDPGETPEIADISKTNVLGRYNKDVTDEVRGSWQFHVGEATNSKALADSLGFVYQPDGKGGFKHPVALFVVTPDGKISRYIHGFTYPPRDVKLALIDASGGRLGTSIGDRLLSFCYMYDPASGSYKRVALRVVQVGGVLSFLALASLVGTFLVTERVLKKRRQRLAAEYAAVHETKSTGDEKVGSSALIAGPGPQRGIVR